jgi:hypothetical protein
LARYSTLIVPVICERQLGRLNDEIVDRHRRVSGADAPDILAKGEDSSDDETNREVAQGN